MGWVVGLTGGIASGKSTILQHFAALGVPTLEADDVGRWVLAPQKPALAAVFVRFGAHLQLPDGSLDRRALREQVFGNPQALRDLEAITHPAIRAEIQAWIAAQSQSPYCILAAAILLERGFWQFCQRILVVDAPEHDQLQRLMRRDGSSEATARAMMAQQLSRAERLARADDVILNGEPLADRREEVLALHRRYLALAAP